MAGRKSGGRTPPVKRGPKPKGLDLAGIQDILEDRFDNDEQSGDRRGLDVVMFPPEEDAGAVSECDSDDSDDPECNMNKLPPRLLKAGGEVSIRGSGTAAITTAGVIKLLDEDEGGPLTDGDSEDDEDDDESDKGEDDTVAKSPKNNKSKYVDPVYGAFDGQTFSSSEDETEPKQKKGDNFETVTYQVTPTGLPIEIQSVRESTKNLPKVKGAALLAQATAKHTRAPPPPSPASFSGDFESPRGRGTATQSSRGAPCTALGTSTTRPTRGRGASTSSKPSTRGRGTSATSASDRGTSTSSKPSTRGRGASATSARGRGTSSKRTSSTPSPTPPPAKRRKQRIAAQQDEDDVEDDSDVNEDDMNDGDDESDEASEGTEEGEDKSKKKKKKGKKKKNPEYDREWTAEDPNKVGDNVGAFTPTPNKCDSEELKDLKSPYHFYRLFMPDEYLEEIEAQSRMYSIQIGKENYAHLVNKDSILCSQAIMLLSGYSKVPRRRMYWLDAPDVFNPLVSENMRRDHFDHVLEVLHFVDNQNLDKEDRFAKVRPMFDNINKCCKIYLPQTETYSVDEIMVPYFGPHGDKQYIRGKPTRYGFKLWGLCGANGTIRHVEPYCGSSTLIEKTELGQGPDVVLGLAHKGEVAPGSKLYFDNLFTSVPLLEKLGEKGLGGTGTMRQNRLGPVPINKKKEVEKTWARGDWAEIYSGDIALSVWKDNKAVFMASNTHKAEEVGTCSRWSKEQKKRITVEFPNVVKQYNSHMGGVDVLDMMTAAYRIRIRVWCIYNWSLSVSCINAWRLMCHVKGLKVSEFPYLNFLRGVVQEMLKKHGIPRTKPGAALVLRGAAANSVRMDRMDHWPVASEGKCRCKVCPGRSSIKCEKCNVCLHTTPCFKDYHVTPGGEF